jgi:hypothetical protein
MQAAQLQDNDCRGRRTFTRFLETLTKFIFLNWCNGIFREKSLEKNRQRTVRKNNMALEEEQAKRSQRS